MKVSEIPKKRLNELNSGSVETSNLTEWLAVDQKKLVLAVASDLDCEELKVLSKKVPAGTAPKQIAWIGGQLVESDVVDELKVHSSDVVRCWACYALAGQNKELKKSLAAMKVFAKDTHFGLREIAWLAIREQICEQPKQAVKLLLPWAKDKNEYIRRFASEATRPRGVWAKHITLLKTDPTPALPLLSLLKHDQSRYVQDSVGNWLNDAAKDNPQWVESVVKTWKTESDTPETAYIIKRATRSFK